MRRHADSLMITLPYDAHSQKMIDALLDQKKRLPIIITEINPIKYDPAGRPLVEIGIVRSYYSQTNMDWSLSLQALQWTRRLLNVWQEIIHKCRDSRNDYYYISREVIS